MLKACLHLTVDTCVFCTAVHLRSTYIGCQSQENHFKNAMQKIRGEMGFGNFQLKRDNCTKELEGNRRQGGTNRAIRRLLRPDQYSCNVDWPFVKRDFWICRGPKVFLSLLRCFEDWIGLNGYFFLSQMVSQAKLQITLR